jgi:hypothetical protein
MNAESSFQRLLTWRAQQAEASAPPPPRAACLLELARPWWTRMPTRFQELLGQLGAIHVRYGHAMVAGEPRGRGFPVPAIVERKNAEVSSLAHIGYFHLEGGRLRLRFHLQPALESAETSVNATFVADDEPTVLLEAKAILGPAGEYRIDVELPATLAASWAALKVTDRMPFRFIIRDSE